MSEIKLKLAVRTATGKKLKSIREEGLIPSVIYGKGKEPILGQSPYNDTEKAVKTAGYHSPLDLDIDGKKRMALVKNVSIDPVSRRIVSVEFQRISAKEAVEATTPIVLVGFEESEANKLHLAISQVMEEIDVKAKPSDLPKELVIDISGFTSIEDRATLANIKLPEGVEFADKELDLDQVVATLYDPVAEAAAREAAEAKAAEETAAAEAAEAGEESSEGDASSDDASSDAAENTEADAEKSE